MKPFDTRAIEFVLLVVGLLLVGRWAVSESDTRAYQAGAERRLDAWEGGEQGTRAAARSLGVIGRLVIPRVGISVMIAEGDDSGTLGRAVGHVRGTAYPGEPGNATLAGHRDTFFRGLEDLRVGDRIRVVTPDGTFHYRVQGTAVVSPRNVEVMRDGPEPTLTLVTCYPFTFIGPAPQRFVVRATALDRV